MSESNSRAHFAVVGLGVMGRNLALNVRDRGFKVAVWTRNTENVKKFIEKNPSRNITGAMSLEELAASLDKPRKIMMMIKAGKPVDDTIEKLKPLLEKGDILIDGGNSWFEDTRRRESVLASEGIYYYGTGVSGGEEGARHGSSLMPGGAPEAYEHLRPVYESIAAKTDSGPCVTHIGSDGAGHFVKMAHNGIEYAIMQAIAESYHVMRDVLKLGHKEMAGVFDKWNRGELNSFLIELTATVLQVKDGETGNPLVEMILDEAGQKGTGRWTAMSALELDVPVPSINAALDARTISGLKEQRHAASEIKGPAPEIDLDKSSALTALHDALFASFITSFAQGMNLIAAASRYYDWKIDLKEVARIWKGGCIIRAGLLNQIMEAYRNNPGLSNLIVDAELSSKLENIQQNWRNTIAQAQSAGIPTPAMSGGLAYFDSLRTPKHPQNLIQAQRDAFGAHTYRRKDHPEWGFIHTEWWK